MHPFLQSLTDLLRSIKFCELLVLVLVSNCNNYDLKDKLENPGGNKNQSLGLRIFVTAASFTGNQIMGAAGADQKCAADANKPEGGLGTYKALIVDATNNTRIACTSDNCTGLGPAEHVNWVLKPDTLYYKSDGKTSIARTNANGIWPAPFTLENSVGSDPIYVWTGMAMNGGTSWTGVPSQDCQGWTSNIHPSGIAGLADATNDAVLSAGGLACGQPNRLYCVEQ